MSWDVFKFKVFADIARSEGGNQEFQAGDFVEGYYQDAWMAEDSIPPSFFSGVVMERFGSLCCGAFIDGLRDDDCVITNVVKPPKPAILVEFDRQLSTPHQPFHSQCVCPWRRKSDDEGRYIRW